MSRIFVAVVCSLLVMRGESSGHRLDEYLQAARVSLAHDRIALELDLTPGASIASTIVTLLDRDGDSAISPLEAEAYGRVVLADLVLDLDDHPVAAALARVEIPSIEEMRDGVGTIQLRAVGTIEAEAGRRRYLHFRNNHLPGASVYLVNALMPEEGDVRVVTQVRDLRQQEVRIEYHVGAPGPAPWLWLLLGVSGLPVLVALRRAGANRRGRL